MTTLPFSAEAEFSAYWARQPMPPRAAWLDQYAALLGKFRPRRTVDAAYRAAEDSFTRQSCCHPRLALACDLMLGPLQD